VTADRPFPSLLIRADALIPQGDFAENQARYLAPDPAVVSDLDALLAAHEVGLVAHFYMDVELQGVLSALGHPHVHISDSLVMADRAVEMVRAGARRVVVMGVDFMSENVRAVLDAAGHADVPVYRLAQAEIGCSLAASAEGRAYGAWLAKASRTPRSLHVVYINTSLQVKARAHAVVPTITCTSSNVVRTVLQAAAQIPELNIWYGPDTYMGENLRAMFERLAEGPDEDVAALHAGHDAASVAALLSRFEVFPQGNCVVHHMFGDEVARRVRRDYGDALHTAHLEVPGEMFALASEAQAAGRGVVGSTSDILRFIVARLGDALSGGDPARLRVVLGTEAGMITAIVRRVQAALAEAGRADVEVEIVFPVAAEAVAQEDQLGIVPGVAGGEGCSTAGGCATCPYMKMNDLDALFDLLEGLEAGSDLAGFAPKVYAEDLGGRSVAEVGGEPILHMRAFQSTGALPDPLVEAVLGVT